MMTALTHDVYENTRTYAKIEAFQKNLKQLKLNALSHCGVSGRKKKGNQKMKVYPTMLLKTNVEKLSVLC
jgi:hypothetical protein